MSCGSFELGTSGSVFAEGPSFGVGSTSVLEGASATGALGRGASPVSMSSLFWESPAQAAAVKATLTVNKAQGAHEPPFIDLFQVSFIVDSTVFLGERCIPSAGVAVLSEG